MIGLTLVAVGVCMVAYVAYINVLDSRRRAALSPEDRAKQDREDATFHQAW